MCHQQADAADEILRHLHQQVQRRQARYGRDEADEQPHIPRQLEVVGALVIPDGVHPLGGHARAETDQNVGGGQGAEVASRSSGKEEDERDGAHALQGGRQHAGASGRLEASPT